MRLRVRFRQQQLFDLNFDQHSRNFLEGSEIPKYSPNKFLYLISMLAIIILILPLAIFMHSTALLQRTNYEFSGKVYCAHEKSVYPASFANVSLLEYSAASGGDDDKKLAMTTTDQHGNFSLEYSSSKAFTTMHWPYISFEHSCASQTNVTEHLANRCYFMHSIFWEPRHIPLMKTSKMEESRADENKNYAIQSDVAVVKCPSLAFVIQ